MLPGEPEQGSQRRIRLQLFLVGAFLLYVELLLIRWISTEIRVFAYFKNLTLIGCFLGMGIGCMLVGRIRLRFAWSYPMLLLFVAAVMLPNELGLSVNQLVSQFLGEMVDMPLWVWAARTGGAAPKAGALAALIFFFLLITLVFVPGGHSLAVCMGQSVSKIRGYSANVVGSLVGIWCFSATSYLSLPPPYWFAVAAVVGLPLLHGWRDWAVAIGCTAGLIGLFYARGAGSESTVWSPYQKLSYQPAVVSDSNGRAVQTGYTLQVNETFYQRIANLDQRFLSAHPDLFPEAADQDHIGYNLAYRIPERAEEVLVVGAGTGNDVAAALRNGASHVDAVEIDPRIIDIGRGIHPEHPYDDPRVNVHVDDARSYFKKCSRKYDLIVMGALDSHTLNSALSNLRIDNFVYTVEAFREVRTLLRPDGLLWLVFAFEQPFIGERLYLMLQDAFGVPPVAFINREVGLLSSAGGGATFVIDREGRIEERIAARPRVRQIVEGTRMKPHSSVNLASDDWPYLYLRSPSVPRLYLVVMGAIVLVAAALTRPFIQAFHRIEPHFFLLGAAFLLVEVQSISRMALLLGNTWIVNALVISAILIMILLANVSASLVSPRALPVVYVALFASILISYGFPLESLLSLNGPSKAAAASVVIGMPIFFAGIIFIRTFATTADAGTALGSNLLGAIIGGACESASFVAGLNSLALLALIFYVASFLYLFLRGELRLMGGRPS